MDYDVVQRRLIDVSWVVTPMLKIVGALQASTKSNPLIPMGTPDPYAPPAAPR